MAPSMISPPHTPPTNTGPQYSKPSRTGSDGMGTLAVHAGAILDYVNGAVSAPINMSSNYAHTAVGETVGNYVYSRKSDPNREVFEAAVAALEHAEYGLAFSSGSATVATIVQSLGGDSHILAISDVYSGTYRYLMQIAEGQGVSTSLTSRMADDLASQIRSNTKMLWIESPSNPLLQLTDVEIVAKEAHKLGLIVVVDSTLPSPYIFNPLDHGADIVMHSATKWLSGHSDCVLGVLATNDSRLHKRLAFLQNAIGAVPSPFDCWLAHRGLKTVQLRVERANITALAVASFLENSPLVVSTSYPGLESHPQRPLVRKQHNLDGAGGGIVSFRIKGGFHTAQVFCQKLRLFTLAESFGGVQSLCEVPGPMTHVLLTPEEREAIGLPDDLVRLSFGIEDTKDILADVQKALEASQR